MQSALQCITQFRRVEIEEDKIKVQVEEVMNSFFFKKRYPWIHSKPLNKALFYNMLPFLEAKEKGRISWLVL